jgi:hypothetical protein
MKQNGFNARRTVAAESQAFITNFYQESKDFVTSTHTHTLAIDNFRTHANGQFQQSEP